MFKRRKAALAVLALAAVAVFGLPASSASAGTATVANACANSVTANFSQIGVTTTGDDGVNFASPGQALSESASQSAAIPGAIFVAGYNLGLLTVGVNNVPANVRSTIEATNTVEGSQNTNVVGGSPPNGTVSVTTTITDPDGTPGTGDETATDASFSVTYNNLNWTAGAGGTIDYRQQSIAVAPPTAANNTLLINALVGGVFNVQFRCAPGTVTPPDPGIITLIDPAPSFDTTVIDCCTPVSNAGPDQTVGLGAPVTLDGSASTDGDLPNDTLTYAWSQTGGTPVTLSDPTAVMPTFTAPVTQGDLTFSLLVTDQAGKTSLADTVTIHVTDVNPPVANAGLDQLNVPAGTTVTLDGSASTDPDLPNDTLTYSWTQTSGPAVTLSDPTAVMPTFTMPGGDVTFQLQVTDQAGNTSTDSVMVTVQVIVPTCDTAGDASGLVIVNGPVKGGATTKVYVLKVTNTGTVTCTIDSATLISADVLVNGAVNGSVSPITGTKTISPGGSARFRLRWTGGPLVTGDSVEFTACVNLPADTTPADNCGSETRIAG